MWVQYQETGKKYDRSESLIKATEFIHTSIELFFELTLHLKQMFIFSSSKKNKEQIKVVIRSEGEKIKQQTFTTFPQHKNVTFNDLSIHTLSYKKIASS